MSPVSATPTDPSDAMVEPPPQPPTTTTTRDMRAPSQRQASKQQRPRGASNATRPRNAVLDQLAGLYPAVFADVVRPLKRGIYQDLLAAHPQAFDKTALKEALGQHTRSTRYLKAMADNLPRHDLQGQAVEALAPEHAYHALLEFFKRQHARTGQDVRDTVQTRMLQLLDASGLHRQDYALRVRNKDEAANAMLDAVLAHAAQRAAKDQALQRAHAASGQSLQDFASAYGMDSSSVAQSLARAALMPQTADGVPQ